MNKKRIVITGGPGTGKTSIINELKSRGFTCLEEISRQVTIEARETGIEQLFLTDPLLFSKLLLEGRTNQFYEASLLESEHIFLDRGIPDVIAYMDYARTDYPESFITSCETNLYNHIFILSPWQEIYVSDNERYENFDQAIEIHEFLVNTYKRFGYMLHDVPFESIKKRTDYIIDTLGI